ncbi:MAG TPA: hypothetical protein VFK79_01920 [Xanthobacteraceae bacterium]|nr:hypothetical protein [Xanthobacteraceae bacterium]
MRLSTLLLRVSITLLLLGLCLGIGMAMKQDFRLAPTHAHLNLVGFVIMFLAGLYYRLVPAAETLGLAKAHAYLHLAAAVIFPIGIAAVTVVDHSYEFLAIIGSLIFLAAMILFTVVVYRTSGTLAAS